VILRRVDVTIGEVAAHSGITASTIRYYEKAGVLRAPARASGRRVYESGVLHQLVIIRFAKDTGFTLLEIKLLLGGFPATAPASARWRRMADAKMKELERTLSKVRAMKEMLAVVKSCRCRSLEQCARSLAARPEKWRRTGHRAVAQPRY
jgi:MerR family redox-sensitive transcriptional activator SoxR